MLFLGTSPDALILVNPEIPPHERSVTRVHRFRVYRRFAMVGFETGMPIAYALAADHLERLHRLVVGESIVPGVTPSPPLIVPTLNARLWHIAFNRLAGEVNERLVRGREDVYFGAEYAASAGTPLPDEVVRHYIDRLASDPDALAFQGISSCWNAPASSRPGTTAE